MGKRHEHGPSGGRPFNENSRGPNKSRKGKHFFDLSVSRKGTKLPAESEPTPPAPVDGDALLREIRRLPRYIDRRGLVNEPLDKPNEE